MQLIEKRTGIRINVEQLEAELADALSGLKDERVVKPTSFKISEMDLSGNMNGILPFSQTDIEDRVESCSGRVFWSKVKYAEGEEAGYDAQFSSVIPEQDILVHQASLIPDKTGDIFRNRAIGDPNFQFTKKGRRIIGNPTYLKVEGTSERDYLGGANEVVGAGILGLASWQYKISVKELLKSRAIFFDPEGTYSNIEFKRTYLVFGGIPVQSIVSARIVVR